MYIHLEVHTYLLEAVTAKHNIEERKVQLLLLYTCIYTYVKHPIGRYEVGNSANIELYNLDRAEEQGTSQAEEKKRSRHSLIELGDLSEKAGN